MPRRVPYSAACALVPAGLLAAAPAQDAALADVAEGALLRAAVEAALDREPSDGNLPVTLKARCVGRVAHVLAALPDGRATSFLFRFDGQAWRRIPRAL